MPNRIWQEIDVDELRDDIVDGVVDRVEKLLEEREARLVTREDMADRLGIGLSTLDKLVSDGEVASVSLNRRRMFYPQDVIDALRASGGIKNGSASRGNS